MPRRKRQPQPPADQPPQIHRIVILEPTEDGDLDGLMEVLLSIAKRTLAEDAAAQQAAAERSSSAGEVDQS